MRSTPIGPPLPGNPATYYEGTWSRMATTVSGLDPVTKTLSEKQLRHMWSVSTDGGNTVQMSHKAIIHYLSVSRPDEENDFESYGCTYNIVGVPDAVPVKATEYLDLSFQIVAKANKPDKRCRLMEPGFAQHVSNYAKTGDAYTYSMTWRFAPEPYSDPPMAPTRNLVLRVGTESSILDGSWADQVVMTLNWRWSRGAASNTQGNYMGGGSPNIPKPPGYVPKEDCSDVCPTTTITLLCIESGGLAEGSAITEDCRKCREMNKCGEEAARLTAPDPAKKIEETKALFQWTTGGAGIKETQLLVGFAANDGRLYSGPWGKTTSVAVDMPASAVLYVTLKSRTASGAVKQQVYQFETDKEAGCRRTRCLPIPALRGTCCRTLRCRRRTPLLPAGLRQQSTVPGLHVLESGHVDDSELPLRGSCLRVAENGTGAGHDAVLHLGDSRRHGETSHGRRGWSSRRWDAAAACAAPRPVAQ